MLDGLAASSPLDVLEPNAAVCSKTLSCTLDTLEEPGIALKPIVEPVVFRGEADENASWLTMTGDYNVLPFGLSKKPRQIILDFREGNLFHVNPSRISHAEASALSTTAKTSTVDPTTS